MRQNNLAGIYYKAASTLLDAQIEQAFLSERGPGSLPLKVKGKVKDKVKGMIVPKYEYDVSAPCSAWAYKALAESEQADVFIIIGQSSSDSSVGMEPFETPYGIVRVDQVLARTILDKKTIKHHESFFDDDSFIASQLPLLQHVYKGKLESLKILPILVGHDIELKKLAVDIKESLLELNKKATIVVPVNLTSYGANHSYIPFSENAHKKVYELDKGAIDLISENKPLDFLKYVDDHAMNADNYLGIILAMLVLKPGKALLEQYYTTADVNEDYKNFVSFASLIFK